MRGLHWRKERFQITHALRNAHTQLHISEFFSRVFKFHTNVLVTMIDCLNI